MQATNAKNAAANLVRRELNIPGFGLLLDPSRLLSELGTKLDCGQVENIKLSYLRYKPGMNCLARYEMSVNGQPIGIYAKAHGEDANSKMAKSLERPAIDSALGPGRVMLEEPQVIFSFFPNDTKLASLQCLVDVEFRQRLFGRLFGPDSAWQASTFGPALNYKPERRYVVRLTRPDGESALVKFYSGSGYTKARTISRKLGENRDDFYPRTVGRSKKHAVVAYLWQPGSTLRQLHNDGKLTSSELATVAESLVELHSSGRGGLLPLKPAEQAGRLSSLSEQVGILLPHLRTRAERVAHQLTKWRAGLTPVKQPVHGDFYDKQAIVCEGKVRLIDLDAVRLDDPLLDLGSYIAHLERPADSSGMSKNDIGMQKETLLKRYTELSGGVCEKQLNNYIALGLFDLIHQPFRDWTQDWPAQTEQLLERVESLFTV